MAYEERETVADQKSTPFCLLNVDNIVAGTLCFRHTLL